MAFVIDDVAAEVAAEVAEEVAKEAAEEVAETVASTAKEVGSSSIEFAGNDTQDVEIIGDGIGENSLQIEEDISNGEISDVASLKDSEILGDGIGETSLEKDILGESEISSIDANPEENNALDISTEDQPRCIKTRNYALEGQNHPLTGVPFLEKEVVTNTGERVKGVFPEFDSVAEAKLPESLYEAPDRIQFSECNRQLKENVAKDPELRSRFTPDQLADIEDGITPEGYTWHHNEDIGRMQLVDSEIHEQTRHTGGRYIWGGGLQNRY